MTWTCWLVLVYLIGVSALTVAATTLGTATSWRRVAVCAVFIALWPVSVILVLILAVVLWRWWPHALP